MFTLKLFSEFISVWMDVTYLLPWTPRFIPRPVQCGFVIGKVAVGQVFVEYFCFFHVIPPKLHTYYFTCTKTIHSPAISSVTTFMFSKARDSEAGGL